MTPHALIIELAGQLEQLKRLCLSDYDAGDEAAASGIAVVLCSIFQGEFKTPSLMTQIGRADLKLLSTCPVVPPGTQDFLQGLSLTICSDDPLARPRMNAYRESARLIPWAQWWKDEPVYVFQGGSIARSSIAGGASRWFDGFRIAIPCSKDDSLEFMPLIVAGEDQEWPPSSTQLADVRQMGHEVLNSPELHALLR